MNQRWIGVIGLFFLLIAIIATRWWKARQKEIRQIRIRIREALYRKSIEQSGGDQ